MKNVLLLFLFFGQLLKAGAEDIYVLTQPAVCCSVTDAARTFV